jgi:hypothetical protein
VNTCSNDKWKIEISRKAGFRKFEESFLYSKKALLYSGRRGEIQLIGLVSGPPDS